MFVRIKDSNSIEDKDVIHIMSPSGDGEFTYCSLDYVQADLFKKEYDKKPKDIPICKMCLREMKLLKDDLKTWNLNKL